VRCQPLKLRLSYLRQLEQALRDQAGLRAGRHPRLVDAASQAEPRMKTGAQQVVLDLGGFGEDMDRMFAMVARGCTAAFFLSVR
jgi:hypothetical protein